LVGYEREHAPGTPSWVDLASADLVVSARFYGGLLGWDTAMRPVDLRAGYMSFQVDGLDVAGLGRLARADEPPAWTTYMAVQDIDDVTKAVLDAGGHTMGPAVEESETGRNALFLDPTGAVFGVWQPGERVGVEMSGMTGAMCWNQLASRHAEASKRFYRDVFGWTAVTAAPGSSGPSHEMTSYTIFRHEGREVAGMIEMDRSWPRGLPSHWMTYFGVDDCDAVAARAAELGGEVSVEPYDVPQIGRTAVIGDPHGAVFSIVTPNARLAGLDRDRGAEGDGRSGAADREIPIGHDDELGIEADHDDIAVADRKSA
jgi:predicted enzyme related to lactoylglutathione lyase